MPRDIVFVNHVTGYLFIDIVNAAIPHFDNVSLITGKVSKHQIPINEKIKIYYLPEYKKGGIIRRLIYWSAITINIYYLILKKFRNHEVFLTSNPPFSPLITLLLKNKVYILVYDIFPDALVSDGFITEKHLINVIWGKFNRRVYKKAKSVFTISEGMASILAKYCDRNVIKVIPLWYSNLFTGDKIKKENNFFIQENNLRGKFIIMYSGNLAPGYDIEALIDLADHFKEIDDVVFIIIGDGWKFKKTKQLINQKRLQNCRLFPILPASEFKYSLSAADLGVVTISHSASQLGVPSKVFNHAALGVPLICIADKNSELSKLVADYDIGICCDKEEVSKMADFIKRLKGNKLDYDSYATRSIICSQDFTSENANKFFNGNLMKVI
jgi:hypothetical protein